MLGSAERKASDLSAGHRIFLLILVSIGSSIIYTPAYLQYVFEEPLGKALIASGGATTENVATTLGTLLSAYAMTALVCYLPSGIVADIVRVRTLSWVGFGLTALLTFWYAMFPSLTTIRFLFVAMGVTTILIWWGIRYKLVRLISDENGYSRNIGLSYAFYGLAGLILGFFNSWLVAHLASRGDIIPMRTLLLILGGLIMVLAVLSFFFIPKFEPCRLAGSCHLVLRLLLLHRRQPNHRLHEQGHDACSRSGHHGRNSPYLRYFVGLGSFLRMGC